VKILFSADQHITLRKNKVNKEWAKNRYKKYFSALAEIDHDILILGGDFFDKKPSIEEVSIFLQFIEDHPKPIYMIAGNHEASTKYETFLEALQPVTNEWFKLMLNTEVLEAGDFDIHFFSYKYIKAGIEPKAPNPLKKSILITHARGDLAFADPEYDFSRFSKFDLVLIGDLHTYHREPRFPNVWYPGSPYTIVFHKDVIPHGVLLVDTDKSLTPEFIELTLPQLVKIEAKIDDKIPDTDDGNCTIVEYTGTAEELSKVANSENVVRRLEVKNYATIPLEGLSEIEQLKAVLTHMGVENQNSILEAYNEIT